MAKKKNTPEGYTLLPADFTLTEQTILYATSHGLDELELEYQVERFTYYHAEDERGREVTHKDWQRTFVNWITGQYYRPMPPHVRQARQRPATPDTLDEEKEAHRIALKRAEERGKERGLPL